MSCTYRQYTELQHRAEHSLSMSQVNCNGVTKTFTHYLGLSIVWMSASTGDDCEILQTSRIPWQFSDAFPACTASITWHVANARRMDQERKLRDTTISDTTIYVRHGDLASRPFQLASQHGFKTPNISKVKEDSALSVSWL